jgi:predicted transcriptional regulator
MTPRHKTPTSFRLSAHAEQLLALLAQHLGTSKTAVLEQAVRNLARREKVSLRPAGK